MAYSPQFELGAAEGCDPQIAARIRAQLAGFASFDTWTTDRKCRAVLNLVQSLVALDRCYLARHPNTPALFQSGVRYREQLTQGGVRTGVETWWDIPTVQARGEGSCEDLAAWRVAELLAAGFPARPFIHSKKRGDWTIFHVVVRVRQSLYAPEEEEDTSYLLGMRPSWWES